MPNGTIRIMEQGCSRNQLRWSKQSSGFGTTITEWRIESGYFMREGTG